MALIWKIDIELNENWNEFSTKIVHFSDKKVAFLNNNFI